MTSSAEPRSPKDQRRRLVIRWTTRLGVVALCAGLLAGAMALRQNGIDAKQQAAAARATPPLLVRVAPAVAAEGYTVGRSFVGRVEAGRRTMAAFELVGVVTSVGPDDGDLVLQGDVIAELDTAKFEASRQELRARLKVAEADAANARQSFDRTTEAAELDAVSAQSVDDAQQRLDAADAQVDVANAALASVQVDLDRSQLLAPYDAVVATRMIDEGDVVSPGMAAFELLDRNAPEARIGLAGPAVEAVEVGQQHFVTVGTERVAATVRRVMPSRDDLSRTVDAILVLDRPLDGIRRGDLVTLDLQTPIASSGFSLPLSALTEGTRGLWSCYVAEPTDKVEDATHIIRRRELQLLHQSGDRVYVRGTLQPGDLFVTDGIHRLVPGLPVRIEQVSR